MWDKGFWSSARRREDALADRRAIADIALEMFDKEGNIKEKYLKMSDERRNTYDVDKDTRRTLAEREADERRFANEERTDDRRGATAQGENLKRNAELDAAGHAPRLRAAPQIAATDAERAVIAGRRALADEVFGEETDPTLRKSRFETAVEKLGAEKNKSIFESRNPAANLVVPLILGAMTSQSREGAAKIAADARTGGGTDLGLKGSGANQPAPGRIVIPKDEPAKSGDPLGGMNMEQIGQIFNKLSGMLGGSGL